MKIFKNILKKSILPLFSIGFIGSGFQLQAQQQLTQNISVLFIGNSYTFKNDMPFIFQKMANQVGVEAYVDTVVKGGQNLAYHANNPVTYEKIRSRNWTYIVIQGHSNEFATPHSEIEKKSRMSLSRIVDSIRSNNSCTKVILYMTWGYKNGNKNWEPINTYDKMQDMIIENYEWMSNDFNLMIAPVGVAWSEIRKNHPDINLYVSDEKHPSIIGSYLSASIFFTTILRKSPVGNPIQIDIPSKIKGTIEEQAYKTVSSHYNKWRNYPDKNILDPGFDVVISNKSGTIYDNSKGGVSTIYKLSDGQSFDVKNPEFTLKGRNNKITITQILDNVCRSISLKRTIQL